MAEIWVAVRPDTSKTGAELNQKLGGLDVSKSGEKAGNSFGSGFGRSMKRVAAGAAAVLASRALVDGVKGAVSAASDLNETTSKTQQIFGKSSAAIQAFAAKAPTALGQTKQAALDANATFGLFGKSAGLTGQKLVGFTTNLTTLAGDLASFNNTTPEQAIEALGAALRGESEPIRSYGVLLDDATLKAEAMRLGLVKTSGDTAKIEAAQIRAQLAQKKYTEAVKEHGKGSTEARAAEASLLTATSSLKKATEGTVPPLTQQQKILAAQSAIMKQTTAAQGDFARTSGGLANQQRIAAAQTDRLKVAIGNALLPTVLSGATALNAKLLPPLIDLAEKHGPKLSAALTDLTAKAGPFITDFLERAGGLFSELSTGTNEASPALTSLADSGAKLAPVIQELLAKVPSLTDVLSVSATAIGFLADNTDTLQKLMPLLVAGIVAYKVAQLAANVAQVVSVPMKIGEVIVNRQLVASNKALIASRAGVVAGTVSETVATGANTAAKNAGILATARLRAAAIAHAISSKAMAAATAVWTGAQWLLNAALTANPIGLVIAAVALLAIGIVALWKKSETFRTIVTAAFNGFKSVAISVISLVWDVVSGFFSDLLNAAAKAFGWVPGLGPKLKTAAKWFGEFRDSVNAKLNGLKDQTLNVEIKYSSKGVNLSTPSSVGRYAGGGPVDGPGTTTSDSIPARLSKKEWVIKAKSSMKYGDYAMASVNAGTATIIPNSMRPGFAAGGKVGRFNLGIAAPPTSVLAKEIATHAVKAAGPYIQAGAKQIAAAGPSGPPGAIRNYRGVRLNERTIRMLLNAERILGAVFHITQGSYSTRVAASGSTHAGGGAMDTNGPRGWSAAVRALRAAGFAAWHRTPSQGPWNHHIHSIALGDTSASPAAKRQMASFRRGGDGLGGGMAAGGKVGRVLAAMGVKSYDGGGPWPTGTLGYNGSGKTETVVPGDGKLELGERSLRRLAKLLAGVSISVDTRRFDEAATRGSFGR
jgi:hypothetical protein